MAIIKLAAPIAGIRGTVGGLTYSANGSSLFVKAWAKGANPRTGKQTNQQSFLSQMPGLWALLSDAERAAWRTFAADPAQELTNSLGETYFASGFNWFAKCNIRLLRVSRSTITAIPTQARPAAPAITDFHVTVGGLNPDVAVGGVASASTETPTLEAPNAFDDNPLTRWQTIAPNTTGWLQYVLTSSLVIRQYSIYMDQLVTRAPMDWTFERLDPGPTWVPVDTQTGITFVGGVQQNFHALNETASDTYRINITANGGHGTLLAIFEMQYFVGESEASLINYPKDEFVNSPDFDLILKISQGQTPARNVMYPGFREILATQTPGQMFTEFQSELESAFGTIQENRSWFARLYRQTQEGIRSAPQSAKTVTI